MEIPEFLEKYFLEALVDDCLAEVLIKFLFVNKYYFSCKFYLSKVAIVSIWQESLSL